ncbi:hypothetical protein [Luteibacter jiangsuensis]
MSISQVPAAKIGVQPALIRGHEDQGLMYFTWADSPVVGAQCANCNAILWVDQRKNVILSENKPDDVPQSGPGYQEYARSKIRRFLAAMPACPYCGHHSFDRFVNNVSFPRFPDGQELGEKISSADVLNADAKNIEVALLE